MWKWLAANPYKTKGDYPLFEENKICEMDSYCPCCQFYRRERLFIILKEAKKRKNQRVLKKEFDRELCSDCPLSDRKLCGLDYKRSAYYRWFTSSDSPLENKNVLQMRKEKALLIFNALKERYQTFSSKKIQKGIKDDQQIKNKKLPLS